MNLRVVPLVLVLAAGCGGGSAAVVSPPVPVPTLTSTAAPVTQVTVVPTLSPAPHLTYSPTPSPTPFPSALVLESGGLGYTTGPSSVRHLAFADVSRDAILQAVRHFLGTGTTGDQPDCGQGPRSSWQSKGLSLLFDGAKWVGWTDQGPRGRTALDGVGVGVTREFLEKSGTDFTFMDDTSIGAEFTTADGLYGGLLSGKTKADKVTTMYSGETCFFR